MNRNLHQLKYRLLVLGMLSVNVLALETSVQGVIDIRLSKTNSATSYLSGGQGKFGHNDGAYFSLAQAGIELIASSDSGWSGHLVANAFADDQGNHAGVTEAFVKYKGLPNASGYRWQNRTGIFYPNISLENDAYAWASKHTLNASTLNTWLGEEIRVLGSEFTLTRLGRMHQVDYDLSLSATIFANNDPAGALLAWHGWSQSSRQTIWTQTPEIAWFPARKKGYSLYWQAAHSDPFLELDHRLGGHVQAEWRWHGHGELSAGYYDNRAKPYVFKNGQYGWHTRFYHLGMRWQLPEAIKLTAQYLSGETLMQNSYRRDVVYNQFNNGFVSLSKRWQAHLLTFRVEHFSVTDQDQTMGDDNNESGRGFTLNYSYRLSKPIFLSFEYNWLQSDRAAHRYSNLATIFTEQQWQLALRYFF
jgi:hypothetical protein